MRAALVCLLLLSFPRPATPAIVPDPGGAGAWAAGIAPLADAPGPLALFDQPARLQPDGGARVALGFQRTRLFELDALTRVRAAVSVPRARWTFALGVETFGPVEARRSRVVLGAALARAGSCLRRRMERAPGPGARGPRRLARCRARGPPAGRSGPPPRATLRPRALRRRRSRCRRRSRLDGRGGVRPRPGPGAPRTDARPPRRAHRGRGRARDRAALARDRGGRAAFVVDDRLRRVWRGRAQRRARGVRARGPPGARRVRRGRGRCVVVILLRRAAGARGRHAHSRRGGGRLERDARAVARGRARGHGGRDRARARGRRGPGRGVARAHSGGGRRMGARLPARRAPLCARGDARARARRAATGR